MVSAKLMHKSEVKKNKHGRHFLAILLATNCKKIVSSNTKKQIKQVICGATVLLFRLHLDSHSFKIVREFYLPHPTLLLVVM